MEMQWAHIESTRTRLHSAREKKNGRRSVQEEDVFRLKIRGAEETTMADSIGAATVEKRITQHPIADMVSP